MFRFSNQASRKAFLPLLYVYKKHGINCSISVWKPLPYLCDSCDYLLAALSLILGQLSVTITKYSATEPRITLSVITIFGEFRPSSFWQVPWLTYLQTSLKHNIKWTFWALLHRVHYMPFSLHLHLYSECAIEPRIDEQKSYHRTQSIEFLLH